MLLCIVAALSVPDLGWYVIGGENSQGPGSSTVLDSVEFIASTGGAAWSTKAALPSALRFHAGAFFPPSSVGALYVAGGVNNGGVPQSTVYKMETTSWATAASMKGPRLGHVLIATTQHLYAVGGAASSVAPIIVIDTVERLDFATGQWEANGGSWSNMGTKRIFHGGVFAGGKAFAIGGEDDLHDSLATVEYLDAFTPSGGWKAASTMSIERIAAAVAAVNDKVWVCSGNSESGNSGFNVIESTCEMLDGNNPNAGWSSLAAPPDWDPIGLIVGVMSAGMSFDVGEQVVRITGGFDGVSFPATYYKKEPGGAWATGGGDAPDLGGPRSGHVLVAVPFIPPSPPPPP
eukprot:Hpha_TRINITY_DN9812_c0_g1::TRINITY_DN9812_c0_g1_i2::g.81571::m.81571